MTSIDIEPIVTSYGQLHHAVLQLLITTKSLSQSDLLQFIRGAIYDIVREQKDAETPGENADVYDSDEEEDEHLINELKGLVNAKSVSTIVDLINRKLHRLDLAIDHVTSDRDHDSDSNMEDDPDAEAHSFVYVFINKKSTKVLQLSTSYTEKEMKVTSFILDLIFGSRDGISRASVSRYSVPKYDAEHEIRSKFIYTMTEAQLLLRKLMLDDWLEIIDAAYTLTPRALCELKPYLEDNYVSAYSCAVCDHLVTRGLASIVLVRVVMEHLIS
ncbi:hypothetical protein FOA43_001868 [Brettanomyces nanus]|uniref:Non-structural maintenance of chromosomes element 1 homolog n=1 Tax=Eeniella nana TaxID=13502 RepID=A0A875S0P5_EENNA|nr:uncharacterized protein FOA43_001868 [Brettanomyces nanus]QPG74538.1 hypothetical protein FOA43_001868 [Brettanomyces nanus]